MLGFRRTERSLSILRNKRSIRNIGIIAHIDHGKTTLTDLLLARAGLIPHSLAGEARVLDYLEEEQRRGITIKSASISLTYSIEGKAYLINLIDTPGHVDFTGKVTQVLRVVDGAIVLVDAVEGIMAQTEVVTRQALSERVKPILLINKVDRLIRELRLSADEIQRRVLRIIREFNSLIDLYSEPKFRDEWKINVSKGDVAIGSALHKWGLTSKIAVEKGIKFSDIIDMYSNGRWQELQEITPLHEAILRMIIERIPSPAEAQRYRIPKIWRGDLSSEIGRAMLECDPNGPVTICVAGVKVDDKEGMIATGRIFSGKIEDGDKVYLLGAGKECAVHRVSVYMDAFREHIGYMDSGNIVALSGPEPLKAGETLVDPAHKGNMIPFERIQYVSEPVVVSIEPKNPSDLQRLLDALNILSIEDPNLTVTINRETGEYLLSGIGELHLEIAVKSISEIEPGLEVIVSKPTISYRESVSAIGDIFTANSLNGLNQVSVRVRPLDERSQSLSHRKIILTDENKNVLVDLTEGNLFSGENLEAAIDGFRWVCRSGPLCGEPMRDLVVELVGLRLYGESSQSGYAQIMPAVRRAIVGSILTANPILLEPIYGIQVSAPSDWIGDAINLIVRRRGKISLVEDRGLFSLINGFIPVAESFGLAEEMRAVTSGRAFWQSYFSHWERVPEERMTYVIRLLRLRRGLPAEPSKMERFIDYL